MLILGIVWFGEVFDDETDMFNWFSIWASLLISAISFMLFCTLPIIAYTSCIFFSLIYYYSGFSSSFNSSYYILASFCFMICIKFSIWLEWLSLIWSKFCSNYWWYLFSMFSICNIFITFPVEEYSWSSIKLSKWSSCVFWLVFA